VPDLPGLKEWKKKWPTRVWHSKAYRRPDQFKDKVRFSNLHMFPIVESRTDMSLYQNVLLVGAGTSSTDIARELGPYARTIYQSSRGGLFDFPPAVLPENAIRIGEIASFDPITSDQETPWNDNNNIPLTINLKSTEKLCDIHTVILCTGYHITLPFLQDYHSDNTPAQEADEKVLVTDGAQLHNLHKDIFYIPDPSLIFIGVPYFTATFTLFEFQAITVAAVLSGMASLPNEGEMRKEYEDRVQRKGYGKPFHSLRGVEAEYVTELLEWVNRDIVERGGKKVEGHSQEWYKAKDEQSVRMKQMFEGNGAVKRDAILVGCSY
jgi:ACS family pantothenate transporter-like MFS transporter